MPLYYTKERCQRCGGQVAQEINSLGYGRSVCSKCYSLDWSEPTRLRLLMSLDEAMEKQRTHEKFHLDPPVVPIAGEFVVSSYERNLLGQVTVDVYRVG